ncbi:hypothetical protein ES703_30296 [subsurface metagenome]
MLSQFSGAVFDKDRNYRFLLWRFWNDSPRVLFVGLNPSTADEYSDDPTLKRCCTFAENWGYGGMYLCNLFSFRATKPEDLIVAGAGVLHAANIPAITMATRLVVMTIAAWGDGLELVENGKGIAENIKKLIEPSLCFGLTQKGNPKHLLYLSGESKLVDYK